MPVFVSILPQEGIVQQIGGDLVEIQVMVAPGQSPATYEPKPVQMAAIANTRLYFAIGVPFEKAWLDKIAAANSEMIVVRTDEGIVKRAMKDHHHEDAHGHETGRDSGLDPHIWLSPPMVGQVAKTIKNALQKADPDHAQVYARNYSAFAARVDQLDADIKAILSEKKGQRFMVFHPSWGYFADAYGLEQIAMEIEGKDPKPAQLAKLIRLAREKQITVVITQPQFSSKSAQQMAKAIGGRVLPIDPLARDWENNLRAAARLFRSELR